MNIYYVGLNNNKFYNISGGGVGFWQCVDYGIQYGAITMDCLNAQQAREVNDFGWL